MHINYNLKTPIIILLLLVTTAVQAQDPAKEQAVEDFRQYFSEHAYRGHQLTKSKTEKINSQECIELLGEDGKFVDMVAEQDKIEQEKMNLANYTPPQKVVSNFGAKAFNRMWRIAQTYRGKAYNEYKNDATYLKLLKAINNYSKIEADRGSIGSGRFHESCFAIPTAAVNTYFCLYYAMDNIEKGKDTRELVVAANKSLLQMSYQSWTQPFRNDETDNNVVSVERFQKHVWWVGGNGLGFRSLLPTAAAMRSIEMMDVLAIVSKGGLSSVSQNTYDEAFWTEGFTADGAGWGHGMQCLIWGYPISGTSAALSLIEYFKGTPWAKQLEYENAHALINYYRGSSWHYFKGLTPPCLSRGSMAYHNLKEQSVATDAMVKTTIDSWLISYPEQEQQELLDFQEDIKDKRIAMEGYPGGYYTGTRWFFNNDNLIKKNTDYYQFISMASIRCDGIEMAKEMADKFNFFTCDGMTLFMKDGTEYHKAKGAWNLTAIPGVTSRQVNDSILVPMRNWRGYCSKHNFAAAATSGTKNAAAGFIFEKMNASNKENVNDTSGKDDPNDFIYGVKAHKGYFMVDDYLIALGAGITNLNPEIDGDIWTTIDQTTLSWNTFWNTKNDLKPNTNPFSEPFKLKKKEDEKYIWASQADGFSYAVLPEATTGSVELAIENRPTKWNEINEANKKVKNKSEEAKIFQMYINHGQKVKEGTYAYVVYAGKEKAQKAFLDMPLNILENTTDIQAVSWGNHYIGASFYNPNKTLFTADEKIKVSAPCTLLFEKTADNWKLTVTDAEMNPELETIEVKTTLPISGKAATKRGKWNVVSIPMHQGALCGKPSTVEVSL